MIVHMPFFCNRLLIYASLSKVFWYCKFRSFTSIDNFQISATISILLRKWLILNVTEVRSMTYITNYFCLDENAPSPHGCDNAYAARDQDEGHSGIKITAGPIWILPGHGPSQHDDQKSILFRNGLLVIMFREMIWTLVASQPFSSQKLELNFY